MPRISIFRPTTAPLPLPAAIARAYIETPSGNLELLYAEPADSNRPRRTPIFFAHGGCGSAAVWIEWMAYLSQTHNIPCYAVSYRGHGASWYPNFFRMYFTTKYTLARDLAAGMKFVQDKEGREVVLCGHSSGGGLSQLLLSEGIGNITVKGLVLAGAIPGFGSFGVNWNWLMMDKWFMPRMFFWHFGHPMSPLSSTALVKRAFFSNAYPLEKVVEFEKRMPPYESFAWPNGMMFRFVNFKNVLQRISGWGAGERIMVLAGEKDRLVSFDIKQREAREYRQEFTELVKNRKLEAKCESVIGSDDSESRGQGVKLAVIRGAGHHFQNDLQWKDGVSKLLEFYEQL